MREPGGVSARREGHHRGELRREARPASFPPAEDHSMSDAVVLTLREEPKHALIAAAITPDRLASLGAAEIAALPVVHGGRAAQLGDFFKVKGEQIGRASCRERV